MEEIKITEGNVNVDKNSMVVTNKKGEITIYIGDNPDKYDLSKASIIYVDGILKHHNRKEK